MSSVEKIKNVPKYQPAMTFQEIALVLGISCAAVEETYRRAIIKLRKEVGTYETLQNEPSLK